MSAEQVRPIIALAMGDPAGISPELTAKLAALDEVRARARLVVIGDRRILDEGTCVAGIKPELATVEPGTNLRAGADKPLFIDLAHLDPARIERGVASEAGGKFALANYAHALTLARDGRADAVCFTPFNKRAMRLARSSYDDEIAFSSEIVGLTTPASEFNVLDRLWNARVTSHIALKDVPSSLSTERIHRALNLTDQCMRSAGFARPRIAVAGLNPHAGDGGNFGNEEIDVIAPAVSAGRRDGIVAEGPFPADTVFLRAKNGDFDAVLTMYHDQGQIAMKLMGFDRGVTLLGGFPFPIATPAHGTAYDIAGRGIASIGATKAAVLLAADMASKQMLRRLAAAGAG
jgi:4-hydroxythreonine-4-phosphate dehydrogenase